MSDYRNLDSDFRNPNDPLRRDAKLDPDAGGANTAWGWIAAAVFVLVILAVGFGFVHNPGQDGINTASNEMTRPAQMAPPAPTQAPTMAPAPAIPPSPVAPAPSAPGPSGQVQ
jgi:hypothetical protein